jgi:uncharacterized protein YggE
MRVSVGIAVLAVAALPLAASAQPKPPPNAINGTTAIITGEGVVTRPADSATISLAMATSDHVAEAATAKSNAVYDALKTKVAAFGIGADKIFGSALPAQAAATIRGLPLPDGATIDTEAGGAAVTATAGARGDAPRAALRAPMR